ncbi:metallophosphoesterase [Seonamhaeicola sp. ML3]|uniref:metallophosphoesterase n=1 Tax=Seonamhaeicola sp. ML3 TaxID=2937786 RepID=UPI00200FB61B|nr:metallophosphoesterase [Seonamhaeicola sp. ML3]
MLRLLFFILVLLLLDFYTLQSLKAIFKSHLVTYIYVFVSLAILGNFLFQIFTFDRSNGIPFSFSLALILCVLFYVPKIIIGLTLLAEDLIRGLVFVVEKFSSSTEVPVTLSGRRKFISQLALGVAAIPFASILYGVIKGKYNFKVLKYTLHFEDLPEAFDGYKLTQISDVHSGSFDDKEKVSYAIDLINEQKSDVILFTGDMVNNKATEMQPYIDVFGKLKAKDGLYSVLGNHDYGDYVRWESEEAKRQNLEDLKAVQKEIGFDLLLNDSRFIEKNGERIALVGVENWGAGGFKKAGDLKKASSKVNQEDFKILLSHDPSHWEKEVVKDKYHYHLTLSGHTHGMQFGIEIPGWFKWSPVKWRYKHWAGIYEELGQYINVNRGFGYLAFPGRVGIWPEITVIELKRGPKAV